MFLLEGVRGVMDVCFVANGGLGFGRRNGRRCCYDGGRRGVIGRGLLHMVVNVSFQSSSDDVVRMPVKSGGGAGQRRSAWENDTMMGILKLLEHGLVQDALEKVSFGLSDLERGRDGAVGGL